MRSAIPCLLALLALGLPAGAAARGTARGDAAAPVTCTLVSYDGPSHSLTVRFEGIPAKRPAFVAAALPKDDGTVWVQAGQVVKADGEVVLEAYEFVGRAVVYRARNSGGRTFLEKAQRSSARQAPVTARALRQAPVEVACELRIP